MDDPSRVSVDVVTTAQRAAVVEFRVRLETVEVWSWHRLSAIFDRERLRAWLAAPSRWLAEGEVVLSVDPRSGGERISLDLPEVLTWTLGVEDLAELKARV
jgi:hypothetical protein